MNLAITSASMAHCEFLGDAHNASTSYQNWPLNSRVHDLRDHGGSRYLPLAAPVPSKISDGVTGLATLATG